MISTIDILVAILSALAFLYGIGELLSLIFDCRLSDKGIEYVYWRRYRKLAIPYEQILEVRITRIGDFSGINLVTRILYGFALQVVLIDRAVNNRRQRIILSPANPWNFVSQIHKKIGRER